MRIRRDQILLGVPAMDLRKLMRAWGWGHSGAPLIRRELGLTRAGTAKLLEQLISEGYIQQDQELRIEGENQYVLTVKGNALASASAAAPIRRTLAQQRLHELIERMMTANTDDRFYVGVQEAAVFGSYLSSEPTLGDLDVHYTVYRKLEEPKEFMRVTVRAAEASGRRFDRYIDMLSWPETELYRFLKNRSRVYGLADNSELLADPTVPRVAIFSQRAPVANWRML